MQLILASASPRRRELLERVGARPAVYPVDIDEALVPGEDPARAVVRLAREKAEAAFATWSGDVEPWLVLAADTLVVLEDRVLGKPADPADARAMLESLSGRRHEVLTGVHLMLGPATGAPRSAGGFGRTGVRFRDLDERTIAAYVRSGEPLDKAGAYGVQELGAVLVAGVEGSWSNVVGLPLERLPGWFAELGVPPSAVLDWL